MDWSREVDAGRAIARRAGEIALRYYGRGISFESKADESPVTIADRETEQWIARALEDRFPDDGLLGEEGAMKPSRSGRRWIIDPVDGTRDFVRGNPGWAVLMALEAAEEVVTGFAVLPATGDLFFASRGGGAFRNDSVIRASSIASPAQAVLCVNGLNGVARASYASRLLDWMAGFWAVRSMGGCIDALMVAQGQADLWLDPTGKPWDFAPLQIIAEEAGARFFDFQGRRTIYGGNCVLCTPGLEPEARRFLAG